MTFGQNPSIIVYSSKILLHVSVAVCEMPFHAQGSEMNSFHGNNT